ncbi:uncharacterized protein LOC125432571 [Sphaerodactylus townsendi]|uniref:uncharacterized protein LOC125432571 n=1 Tax=Sphaerodactylus townsendi TaxID=933632 RepID=UPI0020267BE7|nr:uncharacterized protein LOC125432571 [Sphaerodactylus townsendi]
MLTLYKSQMELCPPSPSLSSITPISKHFQTDNTTAKSYLNRQVGSRSADLQKEALLVFQWTETHVLSIRAEHIQGNLNVQADRLSRQSIHPGEWRLKEEFFQMIPRTLGTSVLDLFASNLNKQLPRFMSRFHHPEVENMDALSSSWPHRILYAFSSFSHDSQTTLKDQGGESRCHLGSPVVAQTTLAYQHLTAVGTQTSETPIAQRSPATGTHFPPGTRAAQLDRLEVERRQLESQGYPEAVLNTILASRKPSTKRIYDSTWKVFVRWCCRKRVTPTEPKLRDVLGFLQDGIESGLRANTLHRLMAALTSVIPRLEGYIPTSHPHIVRFLRGAALKDRPVNHHFPKWRLHTGLHALTRKPFESIMEISLKHPHVKTIFW